MRELPEWKERRFQRDRRIVLEKVRQDRRGVVRRQCLEYREMVGEVR